MKKTNIIVNLQFSGLHRWEGVTDHPELVQVHFLANDHRHIFHVKCKKEVNHADRAIEIIKFKNIILQYLNNRYFNEAMNIHILRNTSCEMLADELVKVFGLNYCEVLEDGENGAEVIDTDPFKETEILDASASDKTVTGINSPMTSSTLTGRQLKINYV